MKKLFLLAAVTFFVFQGLHAQEKLPVYDTAANAQADLQQALQQAQLENRHVLVQVGGNWCPWCIRLHDFFKSTPVIDSILNSDYILVHVNFSKENKNPEVMEQLSYPQRFGFHGVEREQHRCHKFAREHLGHE